MITAIEARNKMPSTSLEKALIAQRLSEIEQKILSAAENDDTFIEISLPDDRTQNSIIDSLENNWYEVNLISNQFSDDYGRSYAYSVFKVSW